ncbi:MAG: hypothetical protein JWO37_274, partial [Acidimicrobiales bacterium]|nr:hypothetical protein [Acidimicrobiales bacterium]
VDAAPGAAARAAEAGSGLDHARLSVAVAGRAGPGSRVRVTVRYHPATAVPVVGRLLGGVVLRADATMRVER